MPTFTRTISETFHVIGCASCGANFGINDDVYRRAVKNHSGSVYCPSCGRQTDWPGKTRVEEVREQMQRKLNVVNNRLACQEAKTMKETNRAKRAKKSLTATKGVLTKIKKRLISGACPVPGCNRSFTKSRLQRHIEEKHPDFLTEAIPEKTKDDD